LSEKKPLVRVVGIGPGPVGLVTVETMEILERAGEVLLRTELHPCVRDLKGMGVRFRSLDEHYRKGGTVEEVYSSMVREVVKEARRRGEVVYATPGHPLVAERTVQLLLRENVEVRIHCAVSFLDAVFRELGKDPVEGFLLLDGQVLPEKGYHALDPRTDALICQVDSRLLASEVKAVLLEVYPPGHPVTVITAAGGEDAKVEKVPLEEMDRKDRFGHLVSLFVPALPPDEVFDFRRLVEVVATLRGPGGCPWDRKQTHESLAGHMVEEAHEAVEAIQRGDWHHLSEELGDLLLQVILHAQLAAEAGTFDIRDTLRSIIEKLVRRHPHVFGEAKVDTAEEVIARWERIKAEEKGEPSLLDGVAEGLPSLIYAYKVQSRAARVGFDWGAGKDVVPKLREEVEELEKALSGREGDLEEELGDLLFTLVNLCRHFKADPEVALRKAARKFARRFREMERVCREKGMRMEEMTLEELDRLWEASK
jgi:tetrapyrrole methylase family protein/MazG family protein